MHDAFCGVAAIGLTRERCWRTSMSKRCFDAADMSERRATGRLLAATGASRVSS